MPSEHRVTPLPVPLHSVRDRLRPLDGCPPSTCWVAGGRLGAGGSARAPAPGPGSPRRQRGRAWPRPRRPPEPSRAALTLGGPSPTTRFQRPREGWEFPPQAAVSSPGPEPSPQRSGQRWKECRLLGMSHRGLCLSRTLPPSPPRGRAGSAEPPGFLRRPRQGRRAAGRREERTLRWGSLGRRTSDGSDLWVRRAKPQRQEKLPPAGFRLEGRKNSNG